MSARALADLVEVWRRAQLEARTLEAEARCQAPILLARARRVRSCVDGALIALEAALWRRPYRRRTKSASEDRAA